MFSKVFTCISLFGLLSTVLSEHDKAPSHARVFLGEYAKNVLNKDPKELEEMIFWLIEQRIDQNHDMKISLDEMKHWMERVYHDDLEKNIMAAFFACNKKMDHDITLAEYQTCINSKKETPPPTEKSEARLLARWIIADGDGDNKLSLGEFGAFYAPTEMHHQKMHGLLVDEYIEDRDTDDDMQVSFQELVSLGEQEGNSDDKWKLGLKEWFKTVDTDKDGQLSHPEIEHDMFPSIDDPADEEAKHVMGDADDDKDGHITHEEMLANLETFVGSQVLQHGKLLLRSRDEL